MTKSLAPGWEAHFADNYGDVLGGGFIYTYAANSSTPKATYTDQAGLTARDNPIELDAAGRAIGGIWLNPGEAYKFIVKTSAGVTLDTVDQIVSGESSSASDEDFLVHLVFEGTPGAQGFMGGLIFDREVLFPVDFAGSYGSIGTNPGSDFVISIQKNGVEVGTLTFNSVGTAAFDTTGGATVTCDAGDRLKLIGPSSVGTGADFLATFVGAVQ